MKNQMLKVWQARQKIIDEWFIKPENEGCDMKDCSLISDFEFHDGDASYNSAKVSFVWVDTGEKVYLEVSQVGQGIPYYRVDKFCTGKEYNDTMTSIAREKTIKAVKLLRDADIRHVADTDSFIVDRNPDSEVVRKVEALGFEVKEIWK